MAIKLLSSDLNGTLVRQHTMSDMIRVYVGDEEYRRAKEVFDRQTNGTASMEEAFSVAGPLTKGISLRQAIEYTQFATGPMRYVEGVGILFDTLARHNVPLVINSTGYSVTIYAIREGLGKGVVHGQIGNCLRFGYDGDATDVLAEADLEKLVRDWYSYPEAQGMPVYDHVKATGEIELGIKDEKDKTRLLLEYAKTHFPWVRPKEMAHVGDTMGDSEAIYGITKLGGLGIAFNYNEALRRFVEERNREVGGRMRLISPKSETSDIKHIITDLGW